MKHSKLLAAGLLGAAFSLFPLAGASRAADHGDAPNVDNDSGADIADLFAFLDPNDNSKVCIIGTFHGFITPGEAVNFAAFDPNVLYRFAIDNAGDAKPDDFIDITFSERTGAGVAQTATIKLPGEKKAVTAQTTPSTIAATPNPQNVQTLGTTGVSFFAGEADDPFFFDIPGFNRFVASVKAGIPDPTTLTRGRDTFAGYNVIGIALDIPKAMLTGKKNAPKIGVEFMTLRRTQTPGPNGVVRSSGKYRQVDRMGNPAVNVALIPFARKSEYNASSPLDDSKGKFESDIVASLKPFGTDTAHINALAGVAITNGDYLHLDLSVPNSGSGGGDNAAASFPNGRRLKDDTIDIILTIINNGNTLGDGVNASDVPPQDQFPFLALPQQPRDPGTTDDNTRN